MWTDNPRRAFAAALAAVWATASHAQSAPPAADASAAAAPQRVEISGRTESGYGAAVAGTATKTDTALIETPVSVQVIPQQVLQDQKATSLDQALANVSGVRASTTGWAENIYIRGFTTSTYFRDGFRIDDPSGLGGTATLANVDSIEVLKGPGAILYGRVEPGGVVNMLTKPPKADTHYTLEQAVGSWGRSISSFDATGPLDDGKTLLYRVIAARDTGRSWIDNVSEARDFVAPTLQWRPSARTQVTLEASYSHDRATIYQQSIVPFDTTSLQFQWGPRSANPAPYRFEPDTLFVGASWSHQLDDDWTIRQQVTRNQVDFSTPVNPSTAFGPLALVGSTWTLGLGTAQLTGKTRSDGTVVDLTGHLRTGTFEHTLLVGADVYRLFALYDSRYSSASGPFVDVPLFSSTVPSLASIPLDPDSTYFTQTTTRAAGVYLQDQVKLAHQLQLLAGLRWQHVKSTGFTNSGAAFGGNGQPIANAPAHDTALTPRAGLLWQPAPRLSLYTSYAENFGATNASLTDWQGHPLAPESAQQYEAGAKADSANGRLTGSLAWFDLTKTHVAANDLAHPNGGGGFFPTAIGRVRSRGIELNLQGELGPRVQALLAYTYDRAEVVQGTDTYPAGTRLPFVPDQMLRLFATCELGLDSQPGWKVGAGVTWQGRSPGLYLDPNTGASDTTTISSPAYQVVDAMASYDFRLGKAKASVQLNVRNLLNKSYYSDAFMYVAPWGYVTYGAPRSLLASARVEL